MHLVTLLRMISSGSLRRMVLMALVAGLSNALVLALINSAADRGAIRNGANLRLAVIFAIVVVLYTLSQRFLMFTAAREVEGLIHRIRVRLIEAVRHSELADVDRIGRTRIFNATSKEIQALAQSSATLATVVQMGVLVSFTMIYLMALSLTAFLLATGFASLAIVLYLSRMKRANEAVQKAAQAEYGLHELLTSILEGFKEAKLNDRRSQALADDVGRASLHSANERIEAETGFARNLIFSQNVFFLLLGTMVFIVPVLSDASAYSDTLLKTTTAVLFVIGPIGGLIGAVPILTNANTSAAYILDLVHQLEQSAEGVQERQGSGPVRRKSFREIELRSVVFRFEQTGLHAFQVGPINFTLRAGDTVFISGGNGSGKSTLLRLLTSLYWPQGGSILVDGQPVTHANVASYRALFSAVFFEYHLFKRLYGIDQEAFGEVSELLRLFEIEEKTSIVGDEFTTIELSAGQRKRLALIVALLERRPICILDEWAADQDPVFRRKFYNELLVMLKARGITVVAVSHDDRYYDCADLRLHMEEGRIVNDSRGGAGA
jgi:putative ATP-binding cassette transporter